MQCAYVQASDRAGVTWTWHNFSKDQNEGHNKIWHTRTHNAETAHVQKEAAIITQLPSVKEPVL